MTAGGQYKKQMKEALKEREHKLMLKHKYDTRITNVRQGKEAFAKGDFITAIRRYTEYLETIAEVNGVSSIYEIKPAHFDKTKDLTELLMISHLYFELAKVYDATDKFHEDSKKCLDQFILFTANQPFQVVNSEMFRKHLRKFKFKNHDVFFNAYRQIFVKSRQCYIATHCFGEVHPITESLRDFKRELLRLPGGTHFVALYYRCSTQWLKIIDVVPIMGALTTPVFRWALRVFSKSRLRRILS
ncbi:MAG: hypothetical protein ACLGG7_06475 [Bacteriovoracia bacterium]